MTPSGNNINEEKKEGINVIYDDNPKAIAETAVKILNDEEYRKKLGKAARKSMKK